MSVRICWPRKDGIQEVSVALPLRSISTLHKEVARQFGSGLPSRDFVLTDTVTDVATDDEVALLRDGTTLLLTFQQDRRLTGAATEKISFQPHPKTLTMAGDYEYFAAQGRHPFVYALAEFIDNSLRATRKNSPLPRNITMSMVLSGSGASTRGLVCVTDNGCGMSKHELNDWAVMNYTLEERGDQPQEPEPAARAAAAAAASGGASRFLTSDLSFFGVGSKNAAFFMGSSIKIVTRKAGEQYVHELCLTAADLEARYRNQEAVYEGDMVHRNAGDASTLAAMELPFAVTRDWVRAEAAAGDAESFTRVIVGDLKPDVLQQLAHDDQGLHICRELAHLYHYYLHGEAGNSSTEAQTGGLLPNGEPLPAIVLQRMADTSVVWERRLTEVEDDMETRMLRAQRAELTFMLQVPDKGFVSGVLHYFPYENDQETVPVENPLTSTKPSPFAGLTQVGPSQAAGRTQIGAEAGMHATQAPGGGRDGDGSDGEEGGVLLQAPIFEAFWQGRLIPGARIDTLPFIEAVRQKRTAQTKDNIPDEAFARLRGALFFGSTFRVTRNKLLFRDNLPEILATAVAGDRHMEKRFKEWLSKCHATLDKSVRFEELADSRLQAASRSTLGESTTAFHRVSNGQQAIGKGDVVRINAKPAVVGRVAFFTIPQAVREPGAYANGRIHIEPLPAEVHGTGPLRHFSLRRVEGLLDEKAMQEHMQRELARLPSSLRVEPMRLATGQALEFAAGDAVPETTVAVMSAGGQRMVRAFYAGEKQTLVITQRLWRLPHEGAALPNGDSSEAAEEEGQARAGRPAAKKVRKGRKSKKQDENADPQSATEVADGQDGAAGSEAELVLSVENKTPNKESFQFSRLADGLRKAGHYALEYALTPGVPGQPALQVLVPVVVTAAPPASLDISGEGCVAAALKELALGETLPPLKVMLRDAYGNPVPLAPCSAAGVRIFAALDAGGDSALERCKELTVASEQEATDHCIVVSGLQVLGSKRAAIAGTGLSMLQLADQASRPSAAAGAQRTASQQALPVVQARLCFLLQGSDGDLQPQSLQICLRAGAPRTLKLLPGSSWEGGDAVVSVQSGAHLPQLTVQALDAWGNCTGPTEALPFEVSVDSPAVESAAHLFLVDALGTAIIDGLQACGATKGAEWSPVSVRIACSAANPYAEGALAVAQPTQDLQLRISVQPSALPAVAQIIAAGQPLPMRQGEGEDGSTTTVVADALEAGSSLAGLKLVLLDEAGNPATVSVKGKVTVSWHRGARKTVWNGEPIKLPHLQVPQSVAEVATEWVRFQGDSSNPVTVECALEVRAVHGLPANWAVSLLDQPGSQSADELGVVLCGRPFVLEVEALDKFNNRCAGGGQTLPEPVIVLESDGPLQYNPVEWSCGWAAQGGHEVYAAQIVVSGNPGAVKIFARDAAGSDGCSALAEDSLTVELRAGPPAALAFKGPATLEVGSKVCLPSVEVCVHDVTGNVTATTESFEVALSASALAVDGSGRAAKVSVAGSNKVKMAKGRTTVTFKNVTLVAEGEGTYAVRVQSASRKVALQEGVLRVSMAPQNVVTAVHVMLPADLLEGCLAGCSGRLLVRADTENEAGLPEEGAVAGLTLRVTPPGGGKADAVVHSLAAAEEGVLSLEEGCYVFSLPELNLAGTYSAVAEYSEQRPEVRAGLSRKESDVRSSTVRFDVLPGPPVVLSVEAPSVPARLAITNGPSSKQRELLRNVAVQLRDVYDNPAEAAGVQVRCRLLAAGRSVEDSSVPQLHVTEGTGPLATDARGRCFLGNLSIVEGSGHASSAALECELVCEALGLYPSSAHDLEMDEDGWALCWRRPVLFSDDAARFAVVEALNERRAELAARHADLADRLDSHHQVLSQARKEQSRLAKQVASKQKALGASAPPTVEAAEQRAQELLHASKEDATSAVRPARHGPRSSPHTSAIDALLRLGDDGMVGVLAQLVTVDDPRLAQVASASMRSLLAVVVVQDMPCRSRLAALLAQKKHPIPDFLALTHINQYRGPKSGDIPGFRGAGDLAKALVRAACAGTDKPLPVPLPHQKADGGGGEGRLGPNDWPAGCLGYLCNLVRPAHKGQRPTVVYGLLSGIMVFETMEDASAYREQVTQHHRLACPDIITLDMGRISARGIVAGSTFRPPPLDKADFVVGSNPAAPGGAAAAAEEAEALQDWAELLRAHNAAAAATEAAQAEADAAEDQCQAELQELDRQLADIDEKLAQGHSPTGRGQASGSRKKQRMQAEPAAEVALEEVAAVEHPVEGRSKRRRLANMQ